MGYLQKEASPSLVRWGFGVSALLLFAGLVWCSEEVCAAERKVLSASTRRVQSRGIDRYTGYSHNPLSSVACGPIALQEALRRLGIQASLPRLHDLTQTKQDRTTLWGLAQGANKLGVASLLARLTLSELDRFAQDPQIQVILNLTENHHFMVLEQVGKEHVFMWDGALSGALRGASQVFFLKERFFEVTNGQALIMACSTEGLPQVMQEAKLGKAEVSKNWGANHCQNCDRKSGRLRPNSAPQNSTKEPVDLSNGNFYLDRTDLQVPSPGLPLRFQRHYSVQVTSEVDGLRARAGTGQHVVVDGRFVLHGDYELTKKRYPQKMGASTVVAVDIETLEKGQNPWERGRIVFRFKSWEDFDYVSFRAPNNWGLWVEAGRIRGGTWRQLGGGWCATRELQDKRVDGPHRLKLFFNSQTEAKVWLDGQLVFHARNPKPQREERLPVGIDSSLSISAFDNLQVNGRTWSFDGLEPRFLLGYGWTSNLDERLEFAQNDELIWTSPTGSRHSLAREEGGDTYRATELTHIIRPQRSGWKLTKANGLIHYYDKKGQLSKLKDLNGNITRIRYGQRAGRRVPVELTDAVGRTLVLSYNNAGYVSRITGPLAISYTYRYDQEGNLTEVTDPNGGRERYTYDPYHRMISLTDPNGHTMKMTYFYNSHIATQTAPNGERLMFDYLWDQTSVVNALGEKTTYHFGENNQLIAKTNPLGETKRFHFSESGDPLATEDPLGYNLSYNRDDQGQLLSVWDNQQRQFLQKNTYFEYGRLATHTDALGRFTRFFYDENWNLLRVLYSGGDELGFKYNERGQIIEASDELGRVTSFTYNELGQRVEKLDALGQLTTYTYDDLSRLRKVTDPLGRSIRYHYDKLGNLIGITHADGSQEIFEYDSKNQIILHKDEEGHRTWFEYDWAGNLVAHEDEGAHCTTFHYDNVDFYRNGTSTLLETVGPQEERIEYTYDQAGRVAEIIDPLRRVTEYLRDRVGKITHRINALGKSTHYAYDGLGRLVSRKDPAGGITTYEYDLKGNLLGVTDAEGNAIRYEYDARDRVTQVLYADGSVEHYTYDASGQLVAYTDRRENTTEYRYDLVGRLIEKNGPQGSTEYEYDAGNRLIHVQDVLGEWRYTYDKRGRVISEENPDKKKVRTFYDERGNQIKVQLDDWVCSKTYDEVSRLIEINDSRLGVFAMHYNESGFRVALRYPNGLVQTNWVNLAGETLKHATHRADVVIDEMHYAYNALRHRSRRFHLSNNETLLKAEHYAYNENEELIGYLTAESSQNFVFDRVGNRISSIQDGYERIYEPGSLNQYTTVNGINYSYDDGGNLVSDGERTYSYSSGGRLVRARSSGHETRYVYDYQGRLYSRVENGRVEKYVYNGNQPIAQYDNSGIIEERYVTSNILDDVLGMEISGEIYYVHKDVLGSTTIVTDEHSDIVERVGYGPFGTPQFKDEDYLDLSNNRSAMGNRFLFTGREWEEEIGLYYYRARFYSPQVGRFLQPDPIGLSGGDVNLYRYVRNNPANYSDPKGKFGVPGAAFGAVVGGIAGAVSGSTAGYLEGGLEGAVRGATIGVGAGALAGGTVGFVNPMAAVSAGNIAAGGLGALAGDFVVQTTEGFLRNEPFDYDPVQGAFATAGGAAGAGIGVMAARSVGLVAQPFAAAAGEIVTAPAQGALTQAGVLLSKQFASRNCSQR